MGPAVNNHHPPSSPGGTLHDLASSVPLQPQASLNQGAISYGPEDTETSQGNFLPEENEDESHRPKAQGRVCSASSSQFPISKTTTAVSSIKSNSSGSPHLGCKLTQVIPTTRESLEQQPTLNAATAETQSTTMPRKAADVRQTYTAGQYRPMSFKESIGLSGLISLVGGSLGILGIFGFIAFLWFGYGPAPEAAEATWVWRQLAIHDWMSRAVTLAALALGFIVSMQVALCTSMIAALLLERCSVRRLDAARISIMRGTESSALKLAQLVLFSRRWAVFSHIETWLVLFLGLGGLALQFTSTALLSDLRPYTMAGDVNASHVESLFSYPGKNFSLVQGGLTVSQPTYSVFGEVATGYHTSPDSYGFSDTGLKQRGLLPLVGTPNRTSVRQYSGNAMVLSSRVACMRPKLLRSQYSTKYEGDFGILNGILQYSQALHEAHPEADISCPSSEDCEQMPFECTIPAANMNDTWASMACAAGGIGSAGFRGPYSPSWDPADDPWSANASVWLVASTNLHSRHWSSLDVEGALPSGQPLDNTEWLTYEMLPGLFINISMCFTAFNMEHREVQMISSGSTREPSAHWSLVYDAANTNDIQLYIGADSERQEVSERGILELQFPDGDNSTAAGSPPPLQDLLDLPQDEIMPGDLTASSVLLAMEYEFSGGDTPNTTFILCHWCTTDGTPVHPEYAQLFAGVLASSPGGGRAADALSAFLNIGGFSVYNQFLLNSMYVSENVSMATTFTVVTPGPCTTAGMCAGFISVATLLAVYLALIGVLVAIFVRNVRYSRCGEVWNTVSQLMSFEELGQILDLGNDAGDKSVAKAAQKW
ncbi:hypothetical protein VMCG_07525 [Cytospora schulzeri]|uniref:Uncharacterized protein n=1 Tax=Cytospora schulzeri TaxID=448051 RepID=A0A423W1C2_9PEZI|nr:hypothetical protein VMCG_07525 [Valsa malicola]